MFILKRDPSGATCVIDSISEKIVGNYTYRPTEERTYSAVVSVIRRFFKKD